jgi:hypothetical protein
LGRRSSFLRHQPPMSRSYLYIKSDWLMSLRPHHLSIVLPYSSALACLPYSWEGAEAGQGVSGAFAAFNDAKTSGWLWAFSCTMAILLWGPACTDSVEPCRQYYRGTACWPQSPEYRASELDAGDGSSSARFSHYYGRCLSPVC